MLKVIQLISIFPYNIAFDWPKKDLVRTKVFCELKQLA